MTRQNWEFGFLEKFSCALVWHLRLAQDWDNSTVKRRCPKSIIVSALESLESMFSQEESLIKQK